VQRDRPATAAIANGVILAYRVFDAGEAIALDIAESVVPDARRVEIKGPLVEGLVIPVRPLEVDLGPTPLVLPGSGKPVVARALAHVFDFGAVSIQYELPVDPGTSLEALVPLCDALYTADELGARANEHRNELVSRLKHAVEKPHKWAESAAYTIVFIEELSDCTLAELTKSEVCAKLLLGETSDKALSPAVRDEVLKNAFSYLTDDLVIVDWNSALVVEPSGSRIVPFVLEFATSQLLEFRYYDGLLDRELARVYDDVEKARPRIIVSPYGRLTREVLRRFMELTEFTERVDNAIKSVGDIYLARVYLAAIRRFRVPDWRESVEAKLELVGRAYELLKGEVEVSRATLLEVTVVVLIVIEVVTALRGH
jgi:hypothetical protein